MMPSSFRSEPPRSGVTWPTGGACWRPQCFDPRPRAGGDCCRVPGACGDHVSIRAPVRGATVPPVMDRLIGPFRSAPPCGGRPGALTMANWVGMFRSAPPCGGRRRRSLGRRTRMRFDPRPRAGGDSAPGSPWWRSYRFDPRPRAGGDHHPRRWRCQSGGFRSAPPCGGRLRPSCAPS